MHVRADVAFVFAGQAIMKSRQPFDLKWLVVLWNVILAVFSIWGAIAVTPEIYGWIKKKIRKKVSVSGRQEIHNLIALQPSVCRARHGCRHLGRSL
jgi:hypothetical protein